VEKEERENLDGRRKKNRKGGKTLQEALIIAYDLKHQVDILPDAIKHHKGVDNTDTDMTLEGRVQYLIRVLETRPDPNYSEPDPNI